MNKQIETVETDPEKPGLYTVYVYDEAGNYAIQVDNVLAWTRREAYSTVMRKFTARCTWNAWRTENLEKWPDEDEVIQ